jgi:O-methyltransferase involved in polyketide biosynthesis
VLDREAVKGFLDEELKEVEIPKDIFKDALAETFCKYVEDDYYEWLKDNFKSFFNSGNPDWQWVREKIRKCGNDKK